MKCMLKRVLVLAQVVVVLSAFAFSAIAQTSEAPKQGAQTTTKQEKKATKPAKKAAKPAKKEKKATAPATAPAVTEPATQPATIK